MKKLILSLTALSALTACGTQPAGIAPLPDSTTLQDSATPLTLDAQAGLQLSKSGSGDFQVQAMSIRWRGGPIYTDGLGKYQYNFGLDERTAKATRNDGRVYVCRWYILPMWVSVVNVPVC